MYHEHDVAVEVQSDEEGVQIAAMFQKRVAVRPASLELLGVAHPDQVRRYAPGLSLDVGNDVAPQVGRGRVAVQEDDRVAAPDVDVRHSLAKYVDRLLLVTLVR